MGSCRGCTFAVDEVVTSPLSRPPPIGESISSDMVSSVLFPPPPPIGLSLLYLTLVAEGELRLMVTFSPMESWESVGLCGGVSVSWMFSRSPTDTLLVSTEKHKRTAKTTTGFTARSQPIHACQKCPDSFGKTFVTTAFFGKQMKKKY